jgi:signal transduction histidine kinase
MPLPVEPDMPPPVEPVGAGSWPRDEQANAPIPPMIRMPRYRFMCFLPSDAKYLVVKVSDTGVGIALQDLGRRFREFEQLPHLGGVRPEGTGLGLALTKRLVELNGGKVEVQSAGQGVDVSRCTSPCARPTNRGPSAFTDIAVGM